MEQAPDAEEFRFSSLTGELDRDLGLYAQYGFGPLRDPSRWMARGPDRRPEQA